MKRTHIRSDAENAPSDDVIVGRPFVSVGATAVIWRCVSAQRVNGRPSR